MDLRIHSALAFGTLALSLSALCGWTVGHYVTVDVERQAALRAHAIADRFVDRLDLTVWAHAHELLAFSVATPLAEPALRGQHARPLLDGIQRTLPTFRWLGVADAAGRVVYASGGEGEGTNVAGLAAFKLARAMPHVGGLRDTVMAASGGRLTDDGRPAHFMDMSVATFDGAGNRTGVLLAQLGWEWAVESVEAFGRSVNAGPRSDLMVIAPDGRVVLSSNPAMGGRTVSTTMADGMDEDGRWTSIRRWPDGVTYLTVASPSRGYRDFAGLGWTVVFRQPLAVAMGASAELARRVAIASAMVGALCLLLGWWLGFGWRQSLSSSGGPVDLRATAVPARPGYRQRTMLDDHRSAGA